MSNACQAFTLISAFYSLIEVFFLFGWSLPHGRLFLCLVYFQEEDETSTAPAIGVALLVMNRPVTPRLNALYCGIDPGKTGAICVIDEYCVVQLIADMPMRDGLVDGLALMKMLKDLGKIERVALERPVAFSGPASKSALLSLGASFGIAKGTVDCAAPGALVLPEPAFWKKALGLDKDKSNSSATALTQFPGLNLLKTKRCTTPSHDRAEAAWLAYFALHSDEYPIPAKTKRPLKPRKPKK